MTAAVSGRKIVREPREFKRLSSLDFTLGAV